MRGLGGGRYDEARQHVNLISADASARSNHLPFTNIFHGFEDDFPLKDLKDSDPAGSKEKERDVKQPKMMRLNSAPVDDNANNLIDRILADPTQKEREGKFNAFSSSRDNEMAQKGAGASVAGSENKQWWIDDNTRDVSDFSEQVKSYLNSQIHSTHTHTHSLSLSLSLSPM